MIDQYLNGMEQELVLPITSQGRIDALAMWFDLHLDSITSLSSAPEASSCWEQAIFPVLQSHLTSKSKSRGSISIINKKTGESVISNILARTCHGNYLDKTQSSGTVGVE